jgi:hypothetical protein
VSAIKKRLSAEQVTVSIDKNMGNYGNHHGNDGRVSTLREPDIMLYIASLSRFAAVPKIAVLLLVLEIFSFDLLIHLFLLSLLLLLAFLLMLCLTELQSMQLHVGLILRNFKFNTFVHSSTIHFDSELILCLNGFRKLVWNSANTATRFQQLITN